MNEVQDLQRVETPAAALTLTRSATLAITTAGTIITWQTETRNNGFTWSGTDITIPTAGYYTIDLAIATNAAPTMNFQRVVNGVLIGSFSYTPGTTNYFGATGTHYYATGTTLAIRLVPNAGVTITVAAENVLTESPILHIVQLTGAV
jgi:hypothetical protein